MGSAIQYVGCFPCNGPKKPTDLSETFLIFVNLAYLRSTPHPVTVTTRIITFLVGNPYKPSFATVTGWGVDPRHISLKNLYLQLLCWHPSETRQKLSSCRVSSNKNPGYLLLYRLWKYYHILPSYFWGLITYIFFSEIPSPHPKKKPAAVLPMLLRWGQLIPALPGLVICLQLSQR